MPRWRQSSEILLSDNAAVCRLHLEPCVDSQMNNRDQRTVAAFATRAGQVIGRDELLDLAPPRGDEPFDRSIDSRITRLRRRLEKDPAKPELIKTIRGVGYLYPKR
ncbi:helix-turn-helix domain-containing protein [Mesorhizobium sp.]|uniref:winged helix-turn-helix domain-containing protein n=1 Tax=Mesorhizobium sp. TaxID=1871066 RepID=UPI000FE939A0|nr:helix-turn-helix domain-containing protein [Mesorhizobium sp.]RWK35952.1 MAG: winged helix family transcriptional regulator [Mesorhizobium sp.]RWK64598.1 MAG: winged helix family transcriptional regulator [Mesorhizobium sp.]RWK71265.1 MAG: winged helix family transcriptional regulator [Mesorhizobium sp.]RWK83588.1 MAG: winged helix family transcriptional regulator [Mesorhizobium sp.]RWL07058.1 MAG: winged helix family transcriptional regulator [Mesorhizobium sp.]